MEGQADWRRAHPTVPEQQMMGLLAGAGEHYRQHYQREHKITTPDGRFVTHVDFAWPDERLALEVYGGVHYGRYFDADGRRSADDARRVRAVESTGWEVLVVRDDELTQDRWSATLDRVTAWLEDNRSRW